MAQKLPARPNLEQLKNQSKTLLKAFQSEGAGALARIQKHPRWKKSAPGNFTLADAQLVIAFEYGFSNWAALKTQVESLASEPVDEKRINAFLGAAAKGDIERLKETLDQHPDILNERGGEGTRTALHVAAFSRQEAAVRFLLDRGADANIRCEGDYAFPLHFAAEQGSFDIIRLLVEHGADVNGEGDYHEFGVMGWLTCFGKGDPEIVNYLLAHGARHTIFSAVATGALDSIRKLVKQSPENLERRMDLANKRGRPLHLAVSKKRPESLAVLLELGANIEALDEANFTPLDTAALGGETAMAQMLIGKGARVRMPAAVALHRTKDIEKLLRRDPDCLKPGNRWGNLIVRAAEKASGAVIETLIQNGASPNVRDDPKTSIDSTSGYAPLHAAGFFGNLEAAKVLLRHGADVRARDERYEGTPAGWAAFAGHNDVRDLILAGPIDLFEAIEMNRADRVPQILASEPGALERPFGAYLAARHDVLSFIPGVSRRSWYTPLALAAHAGRLEIVRLLLDHGADRTVTSPEGRTLIELAQQNGHSEVAALLQQRNG